MTNQELYSEFRLSEEDKKFITEHLHQHTDQLAFSLPRTAKSKILIHQIQARKKYKSKLPTWYQNPDLIFPNSLSLEQCSSEATARFKQQLIGGNTLIDMTGGLGVDTFFLSAAFQQTIYFEKQEDLVELARHNFKSAGLNNITCIHADATQYLTENPLQADWIYIDPARRDEAQRKVFHLSDCTPDILQHLPLLHSLAPDILIKTSPVLDIDLTIKHLPGVNAVYVIGFEQECKEVLYHIRREQTLSPEDTPIHSVILNKEGIVTHKTVTTKKAETQHQVTFSDPLEFLYEPHAAVLKGGGLKTITAHYPVRKLSTNSHIYTSEAPVSAFPGRMFKILGIVKPDARSIQPYLENNRKAHLTVRNFPASVSDLRNKLRLKEGGDRYLFATTLADNHKVIIVTEKFYN